MLTHQDELQLEAELQELYIIATHWLNDLPFFDREIAFCRTMLLASPDILTGDNYTSAACLHAKLRSLTGDREHIESRLRRHQKALDPLVRETCNRIEIGVIQDHAHLETALENLQHSIEAVKRQLSGHLNSSRHVPTLL